MTTRNGRLPDFGGRIESRCCPKIAAADFRGKPTARANLLTFHSSFLRPVCVGQYTDVGFERQILRLYLTCTLVSVIDGRFVRLVDIELEESAQICFIGLSP